MSGIWIAIAAGVLLGVFQPLHARAHDIGLQVATALLLVFAALIAHAIGLLTLGTGAYAGLTPRSILYFSVAGAIHFWAGWTFIGMSQRRVGVAITGLLVGATPVFTALVAWATLNERLAPLELVGVAMVVVGVGIASWR